MQRRIKFIAVAIAPFVLIGGLMLTTFDGGASAAPTSTGSSSIVGPSPEGTPTGCEAPGYLCSYFYTGGFQGASDICIEAATYVLDWANHSVDGLNCATVVGSLVNTHTEGDVTWWSGTDGSGQEQCISNGSYYDDLSVYQYPNGTPSTDNIYSSYQEN